MVGGRFNKQGNLHMSLALSDHKTSRSLHLPAGILKVYIKALTGFSPVHHQDGLNNALLSQGCVLRAASSIGKTSKTHILKTGKEVRSLQLPRASSWVTFSKTRCSNKYLNVNVHTSTIHSSQRMETTKMPINQ